MRKLINSKSGSSNCPKWSNANPGSDSESEDEIHSAPANSTETAHSPNHEDNENQTGQGNITRRVSEEAETMYRAAMEGDWIAAEILLSRNPNLACDFVTDEDDRSLHVAVAMKHKKFVEKLVDMMDEDDLVLRDGRGYTACCYAAVSGAVEIARVMIEKNPNLATAHDENNVTPLHKAAMCGKKKMVSYLLESTEIENLSNEEWFDLLLVTIRERMFDVAVELVEKNKVLAMMVKEERTALHVLAQMDDVSNIVTEKVVPASCQDMRNKEGLTPRELFSKEHRRLLRDSKTWMVNLTDSYMLIATILFSVLFAGAFNVPGGFDPQTGKAIILKSESLQTIRLFNIFCMLELGALALSAISILLFGSIMTSRFAEYDFRHYLPDRMYFGFHALLGSLIFTFTAFMLSFQLVSGALTHAEIICILVILFCAYHIGTIREMAAWSDVMVRKSRRSRHTLFNQHPTASTS
ncbi:hypothetical protein C2S51_006643 [Perilla frutescens var. frutescens]|nr:hypothetical protein C2S51_006643 [Perilla frutescens var. frutescens]